MAYGLQNRSLSGIEAIGVDEIQWRKGHQYLTLVYQIDEGCRRLLYIAEKRTVKSFLKFFRHVGPEVTSGIKFVCSDMWKPYLKVIAKKVPHALNVLDRFHISNRSKRICLPDKRDLLNVPPSCHETLIPKTTLRAPPAPRLSVFMDRPSSPRYSEGSQHRNQRHSDLGGGLGL